MDIEKNVLHIADCLGEKGMAILPDKSVDFILCDLPYGATRNPWDSVLPLDKLWAQYTRVIKDNGAIALFGQGMFSAQLMTSNPKLWRYNLIWEKDRPSGFLNAKKMPLRSHEDILVFYKKTPVYNPQYWEGKPLHGMGKKFKEARLANNNYGAFPSESNPSAQRAGDTAKLPRSVLRFKRPHPPLFPTQKPVDLCAWLIKTYTNEGALVLDNCAGSGSAMLACLETGRDFIGFEAEEAHAKLALARLEEAKRKRN